MMEGCQWVGPDQDPITSYPMEYCGAPVVEGKSYCHDHYFRVYQKGTSINGKRASKMIERELNDLQRFEEMIEMEKLTNV